MNQRIRPPLLAALAILCVTALVIALAACCKSAKPAMSSTPASAPLPTRTPIPTPVPVPQLPVLAGTPVPWPHEPITPENAADIVELAMWGKGEAREVAYSPDGRLLAVGTTVGIWLYDAKTLEMLRFIRGGYLPTFTPNSAVLFAREGESILAWWDVATGEQLGSRGVGRWLVTFFLGSARLAAVPGGSAGQWVEVWDLEGGERVRVMGPHGDQVSSLAFSPDGSVLASGGGNDHTIGLWDVQTGDRLQTLEGHTTGVRSLSFSSNGSFLASASPYDPMQVWDVATGDLLWTLEERTGNVSSLAFSPDGDILVTGSGAGDDIVQLWDVRIGRCLRTIEQSANDVIFSPDGATLVLGGGDGTVRLWNVETKAIVDTLKGYKGRVSGLTILPRDAIFISHFFDDTIEMWDMRAGQITRTLTGHTSGVTNLAFSADGTTLASSETWDPSIWIWDVATGHHLRTEGGYHPFVYEIALSPDGTISAGAEDANTGLTFSPDGARRASSTWEGVVQVSETLLPYTHTLEMAGQTAGVVAFSLDGGTVAAGGSGDGKVRLWDAETNEELYGLEGHTAEVLSVAFSPNGMVLASGAKDGTVRLWNAKTGKPLHTLDTPLAGLVTFSPDGSLLVLGCEDGSVQLWGVPPVD